MVQSGTLAEESPRDHNVGEPILRKEIFGHGRRLRLGAPAQQLDRMADLLLHRTESGRESAVGSTRSIWRSNSVGADAKIEETELRHEIVGFRRRLLSSPRNVRKPTDPNMDYIPEMHPSIVSDGLFAKDQNCKGYAQMQHRQDYGRLDVFCSPRRLRGNHIANNAQMKGAVPTATRFGHAEGDDKIRRMEIFGTERRVRSASPEAMAQAEGKNVVTEQLTSGTRANSVSNASAVFGSQEQNRLITAEVSEQVHQSGISSINEHTAGASAASDAWDSLDSPRTLRKAVPEYSCRYGANLDGTTLTTPACAAWRQGAPFTSGGSSGGGIFTGDRGLAYSKDRKTDEQWRPLLASLYNKPLKPEELNILNEFDQRAQDDEKLLEDQLYETRLSQEEAWRKQMQAQRMKPSPYLQHLRACERQLAKAQAYSEAAQVKREADQLENAERVRHEQEQNRKYTMLEANLNKKEHVARTKLQGQLYERLWQHALNGDIPWPTCT